MVVFKCQKKMAKSYGTTPMSSSKAYLPAFLPKPPQRIIAYTEKTLSAPHSALRGVTIDGIEPDPPISRNKIRMYSVGSTNRWRSPKLLGGDFLGLSQAVKSIADTKNETLRNVKTAESPYTSIAKESDFLGSGWGRSSLMSRPFTSPSIDEGPFDRTLNLSRPVTSWSQRSRFKGKLYGSSVLTSRTKFKDPVQLFYMFAKLVQTKHEPDVRLHCMGHVWQLHRAYMVKSKVLTDLLRQVLSDNKPRVYKDEAAEKVNSFISQTNVYSEDYKEMSHRLTSKEAEDLRVKAKTSSVSTHPVIDVILNITDPWVTKHALAIALGHLYLDESIVATGDAIETLAAACSLQFSSLASACCDVMICSLSTDSVCLYLQTAARYNQESVQLACERWLELNLVPQLSCTIHIKDLPVETLDKILQSSKLFTFSEYSLYKALSIWLFMQLHRDVQFMPPLTAVMTYFSSMTRTCSFLEREEGVRYTTAFNCLRLHGITDTKHLQDVMYMNIIPQSWLLRVLSHHYHALQGGGDMSFLLNFSLGASRFGFILKQEPGYCSEIISLHGFHFEAKAQRHGFANTYVIYLQRLRPTDPALSMRACDRSTFSMRRDRVVRYQITVQHPCITDDMQWRYTSTGVLEQSFGLDQKTSRSQVLRVTDVQTPVYVSFAIFFPPS